MARFPIVGAFYRPPAQTLLGAIAIGTPLLLRAEPTNQYDANAIAVWLASADIPETAHNFLEENLPSCGMDVEGVMAEDAWHVGYIPKTMTQQVHPLLNSEGELSGTFALSADGGPRIIIDD